MSCTYILRLKKLLKCILIVALLIVSFHLTFISRGIFQVNRKEKSISKKLNWLENNVSTVLSKPCNKETVSIYIF
jgi:cell division protein FtsL